MLPSITGPDQPDPHSPANYTDADVNWLLDTIARLKQDNRFLVRENQKVSKVCKALRVDTVRLQLATKDQQARIEQLQQQTHLDK